MNENKKIVVYVDLDDTLVNFMSGVKKCPKETVARYERDENGKNQYDNIPGVFALMEPMTGAVEAFQWLAEHFDTYILSTAPWNNPSAWCDKLEWVKRYLGDAAYKRLILSHHKDMLRGDYLIDDSDRDPRNYARTDRRHTYLWRAGVPRRDHDEACQEGARRQRRRDHCRLCRCGWPAPVFSPRR